MAASGCSRSSQRIYPPQELGKVREILIKLNGKLTDPEQGSLSRWERDGVSVRLVPMGGRLTCLPAADPRPLTPKPGATTITEWALRSGGTIKPIVNKKGARIGTRVEGPRSIRRTPRQRRGSGSPRVRGSRRGSSGGCRRTPAQRKSESPSGGDPPDAGGDGDDPPSPADLDFQAFHELTGGLGGPQRLRLFLLLDQRIQDACWDALARNLGGSR